MSRKLIFTLVILLGMLVIAACNATPTPEPTANMANPASVLCEQSGGKLEIRTDAAGGQTGFCIFPDASECEEWAFFRGECKAGDSLKPTEDIANLPNPASVLCEQNGGKLEIRTDAAGGQTGFCIFPDASECEEWALFRGECKAGDSLKPTEDIANLPNPASVFCEQNGGSSEIRTDINGSQFGVCIFPDGSVCDEWAFYRGECKAGDNLMAEDGWKIYRNDELGYSFHYPLDCLLSTADNPENTLTVTGPLADNENWPVIYFNHPQGRAEFAPPVDADLEQWLQDNNLLVEERMEDTQIAGTTAIHIHHPRSPQSYASDTFFFAHNCQLYSVVFQHTGDNEDWDLYNHFLENIEFTK